MEIWLIYRRLFILLKQYRLLLALSAVLGLLAGYMLFLVSKPVYEATVAFRVTWDPYFSSSETLKESVQRENDPSGEDFENRKKTMMDRLNYSTVLEQTLKNMQTQGQFFGVSTEALGKMITTASTKGSDVFTATVKAPTAGDAKLLADSLAKGYISVVEEMNLADRSYVVDFLQKRYKEADSDLTQARGKKAKMLSESTQVSPKNKSDQISEVIVGIEKDLVTAESRAFGFLNQYREMSKAYRAADGKFKLMEETKLISGMRSYLFELQARRQYLSGNYTADNPQIKNIDKAINAINQQIDYIEKNPYKGYIDTNIERSLMDLQAQAAGQFAVATELRRSQRMYYEQQRKTPELAKKFDELEENEKILTTRLEQVSKSLEQALLNQRLLPINVRVLDYAKEPDDPASPRKKLMMLIGMFAGFILSLGVVVIREIIVQPVRIVEEAVKLMKVPVLTAIPDLRSPEEKKFYRRWLGRKSGKQG